MKKLESETVARWNDIAKWWNWLPLALGAIPFAAMMIRALPPHQNIHGFLFYLSLTVAVYTVALGPWVYANLRGKECVEYDGTYRYVRGWWPRVHYKQVLDSTNVRVLDLLHHIDVVIERAGKQASTAAQVRKELERVLEQHQVSRKWAQTSVPYYGWEHFNTGLVKLFLSDAADKAIEDDRKLHEEAAKKKQ